MDGGCGNGSDDGYSSGDGGSDDNGGVMVAWWGTSYQHKHSMVGLLISLRENK